MEKLSFVASKPTKFSLLLSGTTERSEVNHFAASFVEVIRAEKGICQMPLKNIVLRIRMWVSSGEIINYSREEWLRGQNPVIDSIGDRLRRRVVTIYIGSY